MKRKITTYKKIKANDGPTQIDANTFYVKSIDPDKDPYMVIRDLKNRWICDCGSLNCRHIQQVKEMSHK
jgi:hypothetical protein